MPLASSIVAFLMNTAGPPEWWQLSKGILRRANVVVQEAHWRGLALM